MDDPTTRYSIALPDKRVFMRLWQKLPPEAKIRTRVTALFVGANGVVTESSAAHAAEQSPNSLVSKYREMSNDSDREREAIEWSEGLIGNASTSR
jgi:hypothetical protein